MSKFSKLSLSLLITGLLLVIIGINALLINPPHIDTYSSNVEVPYVGFRVLSPGWHFSKLAYDVGSSSCVIKLPGSGSCVAKVKDLGISNCTSASLTINTGFVGFLKNVVGKVNVTLLAKHGSNYSLIDTIEVPINPSKIGVTGTP